jgi:hypothetical protein
MFICSVVVICKNCSYCVCNILVVHATVLIVGYLFAYCSTAMLQKAFMIHCGASEDSSPLKGFKMGWKCCTNV